MPCNAMYNKSSQKKEYIIREKNTQITVRVSAQKKAEFDEALKKNDAVASNVLRRCIEEYIKKNSR